MNFEKVAGWLVIPSLILGPLWCVSAFARMSAVEPILHRLSIASLVVAVALPCIGIVGHTSLLVWDRLRVWIRRRQKPDE